MNHPKPKTNPKPPPAVSGASRHSRSRRATISSIELQYQRPLVRKGKNLGREGSIAGQRHGRRPPARRRASLDNAGSGGVICSTGKSRHNEPTWYGHSSSRVDSNISSTKTKKMMDLGANKFVPEQLESSSHVSMDSSSTSSSTGSGWSSSSAPVSMGMGLALSEAKFGKLFRSADVTLPMMAGGGNRNHSSRKVGLLRQVLRGSRSQAFDDHDEVTTLSSQPPLQESSSDSLLSSDGFTRESTINSNVSTSASDGSSVASPTSIVSDTSSKLTSCSSTITEYDNDCKLCFDTMGKLFSTRRGCARMMVAVVGALVVLGYLGTENNSRSMMDKMPEGSSLFGSIPVPGQEGTQGSQLRQPYQSLPQERNAMEVMMIPKVITEDQGNVGIPHDKDDISSLELETTPTAPNVVIPSIPLISQQKYGMNKKAELLDTLPTYKEKKQTRRNKKARLHDTPPKYKEQKKTNGNQPTLKELRERNRKEHEDWGENSGT